jgi:hypothetical protein
MVKKLLRAEHVASMGGTGNAYRILVGKLLENDHLEDPG